MTILKEETLLWRERQLTRIRQGLLKPVPWANEDWYLNSPFSGIHYAHTSTQSPNLVAYTPDYAKGSRDIVSVSKPRKYLAKHFTDVLSDGAINEWADKYMNANSPGTVVIARTRAEIRWVYENSQVGFNLPDDVSDGTGSCMTEKISYYDTDPIHPVEAYAYDLGIAYLLYEEGEGNELGNKVRARCTVWPDKLQYGRIFGKRGAEDKLRVELRDKGYSQGTHEGARMLKIEINNRIVMPYLDCCPKVRIDADCLVIDSGSHSMANSQRGFLNSRDEENEFECYNCSAYFHIDDRGILLPNGEGVCMSCEDNYFCCEDCDEYYSRDDCMSVHGGDGIVCQCCYEENYFHCEECNESLNNDEYAGETPDNNTPICHDCVGGSEEYTVKDCGQIGIIEVKTVEITEASCSCCGETELSREEV
jgi:hypothetical protein